MVENQKLEILIMAYQNPFEKHFHDQSGTGGEDCQASSMSQRQDEDSFTYNNIEQLSPPVMVKASSGNYMTVSPKEEKQIVLAEGHNPKHGRHSPDQGVRQ